MTESKPPPVPVLVSAHCHGTDAAGTGAGGPQSTGGRPGQTRTEAAFGPAIESSEGRSAHELPPFGIECDLPRKSGADRPVQAIGTARLLRVMYQASSAVWVGRSTAASVLVMTEQDPVEGDEPPPASQASRGNRKRGAPADLESRPGRVRPGSLLQRDWTALLQRRGVLLTPQLSSDLPATFLRGDGPDDERRLCLEGVVANRAHTPRRKGDAPRARSGLQCDVRVAWSGNEFGASILTQTGSADLVRRVPMRQPLDALTGMSLAADLAFVGWLVSEASLNVQRLRRGRINSHEAIERFLGLDDLYETHGLSGHAAETRELLAAFDLEGRWTRLGNRMTLASRLRG